MGKAAIVCGPEHGGTRWVFVLIQRHPDIAKAIHMSIPSGGQLFNTDNLAEDLESGDNVDECVIFYVVRDYSCTLSSQNKAHTVTYDMLRRYDTHDRIEMSKKHLKSTSINHKVVYVSYECLLLDRNEYLKQVFTLAGLSYNYPYLVEEDIDIGHSKEISTMGYDANKKYIKPLYDVTVIVPFINELKLIYAQILSILKEFTHPYVEVNIVYVNASQDEDVKHKLRKLACHFQNVRVIESKGNMSDSVDSGIGHVKTTWTCVLHADAFPIDESWLYNAANVHDNHNLSFIGDSYVEADTYTQRLTFPMYSYFLLGRTNLFRIMRSKGLFAMSDNTLLRAHKWCDENLMNDKVSMPVTSAFTRYKNKYYGTILNESILHLGSYSSLKDKNVPGKLGALYKRIEEGSLDVDGLRKIASSSTGHKKPPVYFNNKEKEAQTVRSNSKLFTYIV